MNLYGFLKPPPRSWPIEHGRRSWHRVSGVNGPHWARPSAPRPQDPGFGYFVASLIDALERDDTFHRVGIRPDQFEGITISGLDVWRGDEECAGTPDLAGDRALLRMPKRSRGASWQ